uniref:NADH-ubiquinone oxidoreductase chain 1 n=1 Tax=Fabaeformiscandona kushiroensis TaxID=1564202 RepID=A0A0S3PNE0_9CRUS|nr:NADH dehydrogenase subunit 1 [Fabaeformiscandona kushiroensis]
MIEYIFSFIVYFLMVVVVLMGVAFITLFERKILGYVHLRKGPNIVGYWGILQPMADAVKLFIKEQVNLISANYFVYYLSPSMNMLLALSCWAVFPFIGFTFSFEYSILFFMCCIALSVYSLLGVGWSSNSKYALLGALRFVAQTISYEVSLALILMIFVYFSLHYSLGSFIFYQQYMWFLFLILPVGVGWMVSSLAEINRTPFDFAEGESELVSGFNVEYSSGGFAILFMAEYSSILFMSGLFVVLLMGSGVSSFFFYLKLGLIMYIIILLRGTLPRFRYDKLMHLAWKLLLPSVLFMMLLLSSVLISF